VNKKTEPTQDEKQPSNGKVNNKIEAEASPATETNAPTPAKSNKKKGGKKDDGKKDGGVAKKGPNAGPTPKKEETPAEDISNATPALPPPSTGGAKKKGGAGGAGLAALRARLEARQKEEEEIKRKEEEERKRIEEEDRLAAEEARKKEEDKARKKEREKAKREQLKKEGKLLTDKQKKEKALAEQRLQSMLAAGVTIPGLQEKNAEDGTSSKPKKIVYDSRKKKKPHGTTSQAPAAADVDQTVAAPEPAIEEEVGSPPLPDEAQVEQVEEQHESSSEDEDELKDSWDAESDTEVAAEEDSRTQAPAPTPAATTGTNGVSNGRQASGGDGSRSVATTNGRTPQRASSDSEEDSDDDSEGSEEMSAVQRQDARRRAEAAARRQRAHEAALAAQSRDNLRSPICCILGHVDTGKTKLLDKIRQTNVQEGEAGGITQQIGATYFPMEAIMTKTEVLNKDGTQEYKMPGLLVIDTPGHESFTNLRSRGSSLCNIAILVVDIMHGLEPQTLESMRLLRDRKTPFIVALNKIDRLYGWKPTPDGDFQTSLANQTIAVQREFKNRAQQAVTAFAEQGLNAILYYDNKNMGRNVSLVPTSAHTGEGIPDMLMLLVNLTQQRMSDKLMYLSELECTVLEVKMIEGLGTTIDVVLVNGILKEGERIIICGLEGPIATNIRALVTPQPMRELRIKSAYVHHKEVKASLGVKIVAPGLEKAIAGSRLLVCGPDDDEEDLLKDIMSDMTSLEEFVDKSGRGVCVQASTIGSLEALLEFLKQSKIPVAAYNIGPVHRKDIMKCAVMLEKAKEFAVTLCFDVKVDRDAQDLADELGIKLFKGEHGRWQTFENEF